MTLVTRTPITLAQPRLACALRSFTSLSQSRIDRRASVTAWGFPAGIRAGGVFISITKR